MKIIFVLLSLFFSLTISSVEPCPDSAEEEWHNCFGSHQYPDGETFSGIWINNSYHKGVLVWQNGDVYVGEIKDGNPEGFGSYLLKSGELYVGEWTRGKRDGYGSNIQPEEGFTTDIYVGDFKDNKKDGTGTYSWGDGQKYIGPFRNDKMEGKGKIITYDGTVSLYQCNEGRCEEIK